MSISEFFLLIVDENRKQFTVEGPMTDEEPWHRAVAAARDQGRDCPMLQYRREIACRYDGIMAATLPPFLPVR